MIIGASVAGSLVLAIAIAMVRGPGSRLADRVPMIDAQSAQVFWISTSARAVTVPAPHPETGARTLIGVDRDPTGAWRILPQDLALISQLGVRVSPRIDAATGIVAPDREVAR